MDENQMKTEIIKDDVYNLGYNIASLPLYIKRDEIQLFNQKKVPPHWDDEIQIVYIRYGSMNTVINGERIKLNEKDICIINAGCVHYFEAFLDTECTYYTGLVDETLFTSTYSIKEKYLNPMFHSFHPNYYVINKNSKFHNEIIDLFLSIEELMTSKRTAYDILLVARFHELMAYIYKALPQSFYLDNPVDSKEVESFRKMLWFLYDNYAEKITVEEIAEIAKVSRKTCYNMFHKYTGRTPMEYLTEYRLNKGKRMLRNSDVTIAEISLAIGFSHQSHFTNQFTRYFGITPLKYRKKCSMN